MKIGEKGVHFVEKIGQRSKNHYWKTNPESEKQRPGRAALTQFSAEACLERPRKRLFL